MLRKVICNADRKEIFAQCRRIYYNNDEKTINLLKNLFPKGTIRFEKIMEGCKMWNGKVTEELISAAKRYGKMFGMSPECYENVDYDEFSYDEFLALINLSIDKETEMPVTLHNLLGTPEFVEDDAYVL